MQAKKNTKKEMIIQTAERLFMRHGFKRVKIEEICREAGASKMTFYKYFTDKTDLVRTIKEAWIESGFSRFDEIKALDLPFREKIQMMTQWKIDFSNKISAQFIREAVSLEDDLKEFKRRYLLNIAEAQARGEIRPDINLEFLWIVLEKIHELVRDGRYSDLFADYGEFQRQLRTLIYLGLLTRAEDLNDDR
ncbi:MAG: TetR/AcrR family transcriptional regulator [Pseudomonadota bacterium]